MKKATLQADGSWKLEDFTSEETTAFNETATSSKTHKDEVETAATKKTTDAASGKAKLKELGLTDDQIAALID